MLLSKKKALKKFGGDDSLVYLVPELCTLTGFPEDLR